MLRSAQPEGQVESQDQTDARSDQQLVAAINAGDAAAFEVLYLRHRDWVVNLAHRFTGNEDIALDVMQETFIYFLKKFPGFRLTANLKTFLYPAVKNLSIGARQKAARYQSTEGEVNSLAELQAYDPPPDETSAALSNLNEEHREVLLLRLVDGLSLAEIAATMGIPLGTVKSRLHNALETLRDDPRMREFFSR